MNVIMIKKEIQDREKEKIMEECGRGMFSSLLKIPVEIDAWQLKFWYQLGERNLV